MIRFTHNYCTLFAHVEKDTEIEGFFWPFVRTMGIYTTVPQKPLIPL